MDIDIIIICLYLGATLGLGLWVGRGVKTLLDFSTGGKNYSAFFVFGTLSASFIGGGFTIGLAEKVYIYGIAFIIAIWGFSIKEILVGKYIAPRLEPFRDAISAGDIMGQLYGKSAKVFTGVASVLVCAGILGAQMGAIGYIMNVILGVPQSLGILIGAGIVVTYATFGGMKSVVAADVFHFLLMIVVLPIVLIFAVIHCGGIGEIVSRLPETHFSPTSTLSMLALFCMFLNFFFGETLVPPYVQRLLIGRDFKQTARGTLWSGYLSIPFFAMIGCIGFIALSLDPSLNPHLSLPFVIKEVMPVGLKGLAIAGLIAVSAADSFLNAAAIAMSHDVIKPLRSTRLSSAQEMMISRITTFVVGSLAITFALNIASALDILLYAYKFWTPFILVPLIGGILGFKATPRTFWISSFAGIAAVVVWMVILGSPGEIDAAIIGIFCNFIVFTRLLSQQKGTVRIQYASEV